MPSKYNQKRRKTTQVYTQLIKDKRRTVAQISDVDRISALMVDLQKQIDECVGVESILKCKVLRKKLHECQLQLEAARSKSEEHAMHTYMSKMDQLEKASASASSTGSKALEQKKVIPMTNRLHPPRANGRSMFDSMSDRDVKHWQLMRAHQKRFSMVYHQQQPAVRRNPIDTCEKCGLDRLVDKEMAITVCPKCGSNREFASHIFENKDVEKDETSNTKQQSLSHMQKFSAQFERGYPHTPIDMLEQVSVAYQKVHLHDPMKVQPSRTAQFLKQNPLITKVVRRAPDRLTKELKRESIPEYTSQELTLLLNQRNRLRTSDDLVEGGDKKHRKSFNNLMYMRQLGRANEFEQSRLYLQAKTYKIHTERTREMESECELTRQQQPDMGCYGYPCS
jgi:hypothetical protein